MGILIIWDNCSQYEKDKLEKIQNEAARIATGATRLVSLSTLSKEIGWESLEKRQTNHKLTLFHKVTHNLAPLYLSSLVPLTVSNISRYNLRNSNNLQTIDARTTLYYRICLLNKKAIILHTMILQCFQIKFNHKRAALIMIFTFFLLFKRQEEIR